MGVSRIDITPVDRVWLSGFASRNRTADSATPLDPSLPLYARVFSVRPRTFADAGGAPLVIVALDVIGFGRNFSDRVRAAAARMHGFPRENLRIVASHTHSGPVVGRNLAPLVPDDPAEWAKIEKYADFLLQRLVAAIGAALRERSLVLAAGRFARGKADLAVNRRQVKEDEFDGWQRGDTDDEVPVMWFLKESGDVVVGLYGYAAHATVLTYAFRYSGDYPSHTSDVLERRYPGSRWLFLPGCGGDQNIYPRGGIDEARDSGLSLANAVTSAMGSSITRLQQATLKVQSSTVLLPFEKRRDRKELRRLQRSARLLDRRAASELLQNVPSGGQTRESYDFPIASVTVGDTRVAFLGGEPTVGFCKTMRNQSSDWVVGYCDDVMGYLATDEARKEGGREGGERAALYYGLPAAWKLGSDQTIFDAMKDLQRT